MTVTYHRPFRVLFVCTGNICRSAMAQYLFNSKVEEEVPGLMRAVSAGTHATAGSGPLGQTINVMAEIGIDISDHRSQQLTLELVRQCDLVLAMSGDHFDEAILLIPPGSTVEISLLGSWPRNPTSPFHAIADPYGMNVNIYRRTRERLQREIDRIFPELIKLVQSNDP